MMSYAYDNLECTQDISLITDSPRKMFPHRYAFLIACQAYSDEIGQLKTPCQDISQIDKLLQEQYNFKTCICQNPTGEQLRAFLSSIPSKVTTPQTDTQVIIYYAGHGIALQSKTDIKGYLVPIDAQRRINGEPALANSCVDMDELVKVMNDPNLTSQQVLAVLDCCFAGAVRWSTQTYRGLETEDNTIRYRQQLEYYKRHRSLQVLTSTSHNQLALDTFGVREDGTAQSESPFVSFLIKGLRQNGEISPQADLDRDGLIAVDELKRYVARQLNDGPDPIEQGAELFPLESHDSGTFLFINTNFNDLELPDEAFENPYKGLEPYEISDAAFYFGRQSVVQTALNLLKATTKPIIISGASGSGKSSFVKAGLLPKWFINQDPKFYTEKIKIIKPGRTPLQELDTIPATDYEILVVDQLEQLITQAVDSSEQAIKSFFDRLILNNKPIICTLRTDFEAQLFKNSGLKINTDVDSQFLKNGKLTESDSWPLYRLPRLGNNDIASIIARPALKAGRYYYPEQLIQTIAKDFLSYPNSLPLLSLVLHELFICSNEDDNREIKPEYYKAIGGLTGVLTSKLDKVYGEFSESGESMLNNIFLRMTSIIGGKFTGRRVYLHELVFEEPEKQKLCDTILSRFVSPEYRLVIEGKDESRKEGHQYYIEPVHDYVIQSRKYLGRV